MPPIVILGAGLTGLSAARHLQTEYVLFEREAEAGGLCRTMARAGYLFDYTGHLLHLRRDYTKAFIQQLLPHALTEHVRNAQIYTQGRYVNYPFQANLAALSPEVIKACILGFVATLTPPDAPREPAALSFHDWVLQTFGAGLAKYFLFPYNQKLWRIPLTELASDWVSWSIPKPSLDEFLNGALGIPNRAFGYNPTFLYPTDGGVSQLPQALLRQLDQSNVHFQKNAVAVDVAAKIVTFDDGSTIHYDRLISTLPLKNFIALLTSAPPAVRAAAAQLRAIDVYNINLGVTRPAVADAHWLYFPEPEYIFYRVGFPMNFSAAVAPPGCSSMYVEVSVLPGETIPEAQLIAEVLTGLRRCGLLRADDDIAVCDVTRIECAYVLYDLQRTAALNVLQSYLAAQDIFSVGRYGAWEYSAMEDALLAGQEVAARIQAETPQRTVKR